MPLFVADGIEELWDTWNIRGLIILSFLLQSFLTLFAPLRKQRGGKWIIMIPLWIAYLLADWVATFTIGLMLPAAGSEILAFWAPFLLLHLGGPDTITSFSLEDNEFWIRHLLGLILQVGSTIYVILQSLPDNKLWLPTLLVLIAGVIKYAERNRAFYLASFEHFGSNWASVRDPPLPPMPIQFRRVFYSVQSIALQHGAWPKFFTAIFTVGASRSLLVGPPMTKAEQEGVCIYTRGKDSHDEMLRIIEIQISLLYELLHTKLPLIDSKIGYVCRMVNFGCILGALVSFSILPKKYYHNKSGQFDIYLTYALLIGALALDLISIWLFMSFDWIIMRLYSIKKSDNELTDRSRWSNSVPQLNIFACRFKNKDGDYPNKLIDFLGTRFETIRRRIRCVSLKNVVEEQAWKFIFKTVKERDIGVARSKIFDPSRILTGQTTDLAWTFNKFEYMESLLIWHIATEICYHKECPNNSPSSSTSTSNDPFYHPKICKLISDYMFYLLVMEPTMTAISPNSLKSVFVGTDFAADWRWTSYWQKGSKESIIKDLEKQLEGEDETANNLRMLKEDADKLEPLQKEHIAKFSRIEAARLLTVELLNLKYQLGGCLWELMGKVWVEIMCYAAINCQPTVHARQVSKGGQLLTLVWLLSNYSTLASPE
ncbi:hypothetical protein SLE2022_320350 [Rubroshorea leprosula]